MNMNKMTMSPRCHRFIRSIVVILCLVALQQLELVVVTAFSVSSSARPAARLSSRTSLAALPLDRRSFWDTGIMAAAVVTTVVVTQEDFIRPAVAEEGDDVVVGDLPIPSEADLQKAQVSCLHQSQASVFAADRPASEPTTHQTKQPPFFDSLAKTWNFFHFHVTFSLPPRNN